jgi:hypothetical protein
MGKLGKGVLQPPRPSGDQSPAYETTPDQSGFA